MLECEIDRALAALQALDLQQQWGLLQHGLSTPVRRR